MKTIITIIMNSMHQIMDGSAAVHVSAWVCVIFFRVCGHSARKCA